jgi:hypothetical protein
MYRARPESRETTRSEPLSQMQVHVGSWSHRKGAERTEPTTDFMAPGGTAR